MPGRVSALPVVSVMIVSVIAIGVAMVLPVGLLLPASMYSTFLDSQVFLLYNLSAP